MTRSRKKGLELAHNIRTVPTSIGLHCAALLLPCSPRRTSITGRQDPAYMLTCNERRARVLSQCSDAAPAKWSPPVPVQPSPTRPGSDISTLHASHHDVNIPQVQTFHMRMR